MEKLLSILAVTFVSILCVGFVACSDDDEDNGSPESSVVGTWTGYDGRDRISLTFRTGSEGVAYIKYFDSYSSAETERVEFKYEMEGKSRGIIIVREIDNHSNVYTFSTYFVIKGNTMYLYEKYYGKDLLWELTKQ